MRRVTFAVPQILRDEANQLLRCLGTSIEEEDSFGEAQYQALGTLPLGEEAATATARDRLYIVASGLVTQPFLEAVLLPLHAPPWGADLAAATRAQAALMILAEGDARDAADKIYLVLDEDTPCALQRLRVQPL